MVQRLKTANEGWGSVAKALYVVIGLPCALLVTIPSLFMIKPLIAEGAFSTLFFFAVIWLVVLLPFAFFIHGLYSRRRLLKDITASLRCPQYFWPEEGFESFHYGDGKYLGIDIKNGTILYVNQIRKGQVDVLGLTMDDWTQREVEGQMFRIFTKFQELPRIEIATPWGQKWFDTLGAMEFKSYSTPLPFPEYVADHLDTLERDLGISIPRLQDSSLSRADTAKR